MVVMCIAIIVSKFTILLKDVTLHSYGKMCVVGTGCLLISKVHSLVTDKELVFVESLLYGYYIMYTDLTFP